MKGTKILAILVVGVMSVSLFATVVKPDKVPKAFEGIWDALVDLQQQIVQEIGDRIADVDAEEAARIAADNALQNALDAESAARIAGDDSLQGALNAETAARQTADTQLQSNIDAEEAARIAADGALQGQIDNIQPIPAGVIVMWSGSIGDIPDGWALCDGTEGTPDLSNRFIYGVSDGEEPGATGGSTSHSHTVNVHSHTVDPPSQGSSYAPDDTHMSFHPGPDDCPITRYASGIRHVHETDIAPFSSGSASPGSSTVNHLPPYYKLAFIMKL